MCRYDEDYEWYVESEDNAAVSDRDERCEDCTRMIAAGEPHTVFMAVDADDESDWVWIVQDPQHTKAIGSPGYERSYYDLAKPHQILDDEDDAEVFEALGFLTWDETRTAIYPPDPVYHVSCAHCRRANLWLEKVCHQHTVLVTTQDLGEHRDEYSDVELGPDFCTLQTLSAQRWRSKLTGQLLPVDVIGRLAVDAAAFAKSHGLAHA